MSEKNGTKQAVLYTFLGLIMGFMIGILAQETNLRWVIIVTLAALALLTFFFLMNRKTSSSNEAYNESVKALPAPQDLKNMTAPLALLEGENKPLTKEEARQWLDDFLVEQQKK